MTCAGPMGLAAGLHVTHALLAPAKMYTNCQPACCCAAEGMAAATATCTSAPPAPNPRFLDTAVTCLGTHFVCRAMKGTAGYLE
jgi:hypothetical protein